MVEVMTCARYLTRGQAAIKNNKEIEHVTLEWELYAHMP